MKEKEEPEIIVKLKEEIEEIKKALTESRKKGYDVTIPSLLFMNLPAKLQIAAVTLDDKDIKKVKTKLNQLREELNVYNLESFKKEEGVNNKEIDILVDNTKRLIENNNIQEAKTNYAKIEQLYKELPGDKKKQIFDKCAELHKKLS